MTDEMTYEFHCDECERTFPTSHGVTMHKNRTHKTPAAEADAMFELVGRATEALFPRGVPVSRIIEVAELQKQMLKVVAR